MSKLIEKYKALPKGQKMLVVFVGVVGVLTLLGQLGILDNTPM